MAEGAGTRHAASPHSAADPVEGSELLTLLQYAGWRLRVQQGDRVVVHATRDGVVVSARAATLPAAAGVAFARAMRSPKPPRRTSADAA
jgi:hypothetical protein